MPVWEKSSYRHIVVVLRVLGLLVRRQECSGLTTGCSSLGARRRITRNIPSLYSHRIRTHAFVGAGPVLGTCRRARDTRYELECLFLANSCSLASPAHARSSRCSRIGGLPTAAGNRLLPAPAVRFVPLSLTEAHRIYDIQRCRRLATAPVGARSWLPIIVPLFVSQMCRAP